MRTLKMVIISTALILGMLLAKTDIVYADNIVVQKINTNERISQVLNNFSGPTMVEVSHFSPNESVNPGGLSDVGSTGKRLEYGDIAMPYDFPAWTQVVLRDSNGNLLRNKKTGKIQIFTNTDRGNKKIIRIFDRQGRNGARMRIDLFVNGVTLKQVMDLGIKYYTMEIIRWGEDIPVAKLTTQEELDKERLEQERLRQEQILREQMELERIQRLKRDVESAVSNISRGGYTIKDTDYQTMDSVLITPIQSKSNTYICKATDYKPRYRPTFEDFMFFTLILITLVLSVDYINKRSFK